jgi:hypothetical protein
MKIFHNFLLSGFDTSDEDPSLLLFVADCEAVSSTSSSESTWDFRLGEGRVAKQPATPIKVKAAPKENEKTANSKGDVPMLSATALNVTWSW